METQKTICGRKKAVFNWSGGKDSALALHKVLQGNEFEVVALLTTVNRHNQRSTMHGIPTTLLELQAASIGLPLQVVDLTPNGDMSDYQDAMRGAVDRFLDRGVRHFIFGDIFLSEVRDYRERQLAPQGIEVVEPLWGKTSDEVMAEFLDSGLRTVVVAVTEGLLDRSFVGRTIDAAFVASLPPGVDVCGENGEYHTFCYAGGMFRTPVDFSLDEPVRVAYPGSEGDNPIAPYAYWIAQLK